MSASRTYESRSVTPFLPALLGLLPAAACTLASAPPVDEAEPEVRLVALTPVSPDRAPMLSSLAERFAIAGSEDLAARLATVNSLDDVRAVFPRGTAVVADVARIGEGDLAAIRSLADAAASVGAPIVLENIDHPERMAALVGLGFAAPGAIVEPSVQARNIAITLLGDGRATIEASADDTGTAGAPGRADHPTGALVGRLDADPEALAAQVGDRLVERLLHPPPPVRGVNTSAYPLGTFRTFMVRRSSPRTWQPNPSYSQTATMDIQFKVDLLASNGGDQGKFIVISDAGSGFNPGGLMWNDSDDRGYFQDSLGVLVSHGSSSLSAFRHQPSTPNGSNTYSTSNGCSFGGGVSMSGPSTTFSCTTSTTAGQTFPDFTSVDLSAGATTHWSFRMTGAGGYPYSSWSDLVDMWWGTLHTLPNLATSNFDPAFETIYRADLSFEGQVPFNLSYSQVLRNTWADWYGVVVEAHTRAFSLTETLGMTADFSRVGINEAWITLQPKHSNKCLDVYNASPANLTPLIQYDCHEAYNQLFELVRVVDDPDYYFIKPRHAASQNKCLDVNLDVNGGLDDGTPVILYDCKATANENQRFRVIDTGGNYKSLQAKHSGKCLTVQGASTASLTPIVQQPCTSADNQRFR